MPPEKPVTSTVRLGVLVFAELFIQSDISHMGPPAGEVPGGERKYPSISAICQRLASRNRMQFKPGFPGLARISHEVLRVGGRMWRRGRLLCPRMLPMQGASGTITARWQAHAPLLSRERACECPGTAIGLSERPTMVVGATPSGTPDDRGGFVIRNLKWQNIMS